MNNIYDLKYTDNRTTIIKGNIFKRPSAYQNEIREVVLYDHFAGENFSLKYLIKFRKNKCFLTSFYATF